VDEFSVSSSWLSKLDFDMLHKMVGAFGDDIDKMILREIRKRKLDEIKKP